MCMPGIDLSSNFIRQRTANHETIRFFVTEQVRDYIIKNGLYKGDETLDEIQYSGYTE